MSEQIVPLAYLTLVGVLIYLLYQRQRRLEKISAKLKEINELLSDTNKKLKEDLP